MDRTHSVKTAFVRKRFKLQSNTIKNIVCVYLTCVGIDEVCAVVHRQMQVTKSIEPVVATPEIGDNSRACWDVVTHKLFQVMRISSWYIEKKGFGRVI